LRRTDCRNREEIEAKGMERKCVTCGVAARPVRSPRKGCIKILVTGGGRDIVRYGKSQRGRE